MRAQRYRRRLALVAIDLDSFKSINDVHGHAAGDEVLRQVATRISDRTRSSDTPSRIGGDEFLILLEEIGEDKQVELYVRRLIHAIAQPVHLGEKELLVGASAGIAHYPEVSGDASGLKHAADLAMYSAKAEGDNSVHVFSTSANYE